MLEQEATMRGQPSLTITAAPAKAPVYLWIAMATGLFSLVIALSALFLVSSRGNPEAGNAQQPPGAAATTRPR